MIKSMTGFGKHTLSCEKYDINVEIKSINSKYFDINYRLPKIISTIEISSRTQLQNILIRGKVDIRIEINIHTITKHPSINVDLIEEYRKIFSLISETANIEDKPKLDHFLRMPDILDYTNDDSIEKELENDTLNAILYCASLVDEMRLKEGKSLENDIKERINTLHNNVMVIENNKEDIFAFWKNKFIKRMEEMGVDSNYDERVIQEASIMGEKADITEEIIRLKSHIEQFMNILNNEFPVGKKLDFLSQEIHRELNTIASKSSNHNIINTVINSKAEIDRIREQIQNII